MSGKRVSLDSLADIPVQDIPLPSFATPKTSLPVGDIAPNPCNRRRLTTIRDRTKIEELALSMKTIGQNTPCAVVTTRAFLVVFPEHTDAVKGRPYVAVTGRRRQLAAEHAGIPQLEVTVKDEFAESRSRFIAVTASENIDRESFDAIEEAHMVHDLVTECGKASLAAAQLNRSEGWVSQRLALLRLAPELQELVSAGDMPIRLARELGKFDHEEQRKLWADYQASQNEPDAAAGDRAEPEKPGKPDKPDKPSRSGRAPAQLAIRRLGKTPEQIAASLREHLSAEDFGELLRFLREFG